MSVMPRSFLYALHKLDDRAASEIAFVDLLSGRRTGFSRLVAEGTLIKELLHRLPVGFDPSVGMAVKSVRRHADLREVELGAAIHFAQIERRNRVMVRPPVAGAPCLDNFPARVEHQIESGNMLSPRLERAADVSADDRLLSRE